MDDLEMTRLCAEAMGISLELGWSGDRRPYDHANAKFYNPLHDDVQAMALVKRFGLGHTMKTAQDKDWSVYYGSTRAINPDLNRAIVECVAKMQAAKALQSLETRTDGWESAPVDNRSAPYITVDASKIKRS